MLLKKSGTVLLVLLLSGTGVLGQKWSVNYNPKEICALQGTSVIMPCTYTYPQGRKVKRVIWFKVSNGQEVNLANLPQYNGHWRYIGDAQNNCSLMITDLEKMFTSEYRFRFETDLLSGKFTGFPGVTLHVTDLQVEVSPGTVTEGRYVTLTCRTTCTLTGSPAFIWYRNGSPLSFTNQIHWFRASSEDGGQYSCAVKGHEHLASPAEPLNVRYSPKSTSASVSASGEIVEGSSVTLTCRSDANPPVQRYTWFKKNRAVSSGSSLIITNILSKDSGQYYCEAQNQHGAQNSTAVTIDVQYPPKSISVSVSPSGEIVEGSTVTLSCSSDANPPVQKYEWFKNKRAVSSGSSLTITNILSEHRGQYYCEAQNQHGAQYSMALTIDVRYSPKNTSVSVSPSGEIVEGSTVTLTCSSDANPRVQRYTWFKENRAVSSGSSLTITNILSKYRGQYYCEAQNQHGAQNSTAVTIDVQYPPKNTSVSVSPSGEIVEGSSVTLSCSSDANPPVQRYTWLKKNESGVLQAGTGQSLNFSNFRSWNSGQYYCVVQNKHGAQNSTFWAVSSASMTSNNNGLLYGIVGTISSASAVLVIVTGWIVWSRRSSSAKEKQLNTEDPTCTVYANVSGITDSKAPTEESALKKGETVCSSIQLPHTQNPEEELYSSVQKPCPLYDSKVHYASIHFPPSGAAPR